MPKITKAPLPKMRYHGGRWRIYWYWNRKQFVIETAFLKKEDDWLVRNDLRHVSSALAQVAPVFPSAYAESKGVRSYLAERYPAPATVTEPIPDSPVILEGYFSRLKLECTEGWAKCCYTWLKSLQTMAGGNILDTDAKLASKCLSHALESKTKATRNRMLNTYRKFFNEMLGFGYVTVNPFLGMKQLKEPLANIIVYCSLRERERIIEMAKSLGRPDWFAVPIAFYAGCRRKEVFHLRWEDVNFDVRRLSIRETKTEKPRLTPISKELLSILLEMRKERGLIVPSVKNETWENQANTIVELLRDKLCRPLNPDLFGRASEPIGKRQYAKSEDDIVAAKKTDAKIMKKNTKRIIPSIAADGKDFMPAERIGWNAWRHTFATLRVQAGVSLDKITSWMGNTPEVCRRHYAQFVPRDHYDEDIDR